MTVFGCAPAVFFMFCPSCDRGHAGVGCCVRVAVW
nr:MAG TPA: NUDIX domain protein [Caudoviricetes sp.]